MKVDTSICGRYVRVTVGDSTVVLTKSEWSKAISNPGEFTPARTSVAMP